MEFMMDFFAMIGRICIGGAFLWSAYEKLKHWQNTISRMEMKHVPQVKFVAPIGTGLKIIGAVLVLLGWHAHLGALLLLIVAIPLTYWAHAFWKMHGPEHAIERAMFIKEVAIIGGLFLILAMGGGHFAIGG